MNFVNSNDTDSDTILIDTVTSIIAEYYAKEIKKLFDKNKKIN